MCGFESFGIEQTKIIVKIQHGNIIWYHIIALIKE